MSTLPSITINFINQAATFAARSASGIMFIALKKDENKVSTDPTETEGAVFEFTSASGVEACTTLNEVHKNSIKYAFFQGGSPKKVIVAVSATGGGAVEAVSDKDFTWACASTADATTFEPAFITAINTRNDNNARKIKMTIMDDVASTTGTSGDHIVRVKKAALTFKDNTTLANTAFYKYLPKVCAVFCNTPITESATYHVFEDLKGSTVTTDSGNNVTLQFKDGYVRLTRAITSTGKSVALIEAQDIITEDVYLTWINFFLGKKRNTKSNELSFCAQVIGYLRKLQEQGVVNPDEDVIVEQDLTAMRSAHSTYYADHDDLWVANHPYGNECYIKCSLRLVDVMESLTFQVYLGE